MSGFVLFPRAFKSIIFPVKSQIPIARLGAGTIRREISVPSWLPFLLVACNSIAAPPQSPGLSFPVASPVNSLVSKYCITCHDSEMKKGGVDLDRLRQEDMVENAEEWERVVRKLRARQMPPVGKERPDERTYDQVTTRLAASLDQV